MTTTDYLGGFQYKNNDLQFFPTSEGYVNVVTNKVSDGRTYNYVYNYTDHLGNVRVSYAWDDTESKLKVIEENHYYPFGLKHRGYTDLVQVPVEIGVGVGVEPGGIGIISTDYSGSRSYNYKYNSKELEDDLGLDWYAMDMRMYDPTIARWMVHDPVVHHNMSPYNAFDNNPVYWADPSGADSQGGGDESNIGDTKMAFGVTAGQLGQVSKIEYWSASGDTSSGRGNENNKKGDGNSSSNKKNDKGDKNSPLKGGKFDKQKFEKIKEENSPYYGLTKNTLTSGEWSEYLENTEKSMDKTGDGMKKAGTFFGGTSGVKLKDIKDPKTFFKSISITTVLATTVIIKGSEINANASALRDIGYNYNKMNMGKVGVGVNIISVRNSAPAFGGTGSINHYFYDRGSNQYLGSYKN
ncbi:RHS repeat domain-containing protein [Vaginella massiliensis]|uniref:RHS repeat domain-containing protein n=1 Tax=Vaginella massiliensis TaxID=1816680 RepID=UPI00375317B2